MFPSQCGHQSCCRHMFSKLPAEAATAQPGVLCSRQLISTLLLLMAYHNDSFALSLSAVTVTLHASFSHKGLSDVLVSLPKDNFVFVLFWKCSDISHWKFTSNLSCCFQNGCTKARYDIPSQRKLSPHTSMTPWIDMARTQPRFIICQQWEVFSHFRTDPKSTPMLISTCPL